MFLCSCLGWFCVESNLQVFETYCSEFRPVVWWPRIFNHKSCFTFDICVLDNSLNRYHLIFCITYVPYDWGLQDIQIDPISYCQPCNACRKNFLEEMSAYWERSWSELKFLNKLHNDDLKVLLVQLRLQTYSNSNCNYKTKSCLYLLGLIIPSGSTTSKTSEKANTKLDSKFNL